MANLDKLFTGSIPELYDTYLVPLIFEPYARDLAKRVAQIEPKAVLETAAGTGAVTRALASHLPASTQIVVTDLNQPMLDFAARNSSLAGRVTWRQADALALPFEGESFDAVACQFGAMFFPDKVQAYREARRVLNPGGRFIFNVWDAISENDFPDVLTQALAKLFPNDPPLFLARTPHGYHDVARIKGELATAGFGSVSVERRVERCVAATPHDVAIAYCQGTPLRNEIEARDPSRLLEATGFAAEELGRRFGRDRIEGQIAARVFTAIL